jgi:hypothetical protein
VDRARKCELRPAAPRDIREASGVTQLTERSVEAGDGGSKETRHVEISDDRQFCVVVVKTTVRIVHYANPTAFSQARIS